MLLSIKDLWVEFHTFDGVVKAVNGVNLHVNKGEILGIVGESGSGKSVATHAILGLVPTPPGKIVKGEIKFEDKLLSNMNEDELNEVRGSGIGMIFQEPMTSLNPVFTIGDQIIESIKLHLTPMSKEDQRKRAIESLQAVGIPSPETRVDAYPHELSGGMRQRAMIAMSLVCGPRLLIADEPTTALDVTIQAQVLELINDLKVEKGLAVILITHDLAVVSGTADRVAVMYAGRVVETASSSKIFANPKHPYTQGLISCIPDYGGDGGTVEKSELKTIEGSVPDMRELPKGCAFYNRCEKRVDRCQNEIPTLKGGEHEVSCFICE